MTNDRTNDRDVAAVVEEVLAVAALGVILGARVPAEFGDDP